MLKSRFRNAAGARTTEIVIEAAADATANSVGEVLVDWTVLCKRFGKASQQLGREFTAAMTTQAILTAVYELPWDDKTMLITPRMRARISNRVLNIASAVNLDDDNVTLVIGCTEDVT